MASPSPRLSAPELGDHYYGVVAEGYDVYLGAVDFGDQAFFRGLVGGARGGALELACGTGRLLVPYRRDGLDVEGLDASADMLAICRRKALAAGCEVALHLAAMEFFRLPRRYGAIYCPVGSLCLLTSPAALEAALRASFDHLHPGGSLALSLCQPMPPSADGARRLAREGRRASDGAMFRVWSEALPPPSPGVTRSRSIHEATIGDRLLARDSFLFDLRPLAPEEAAARLAAAGFTQIAFAGASGGPMSESDEDYLATAIRPA
jgi:SAM-dependent methyltransferase